MSFSLFLTKTLVILFIFGISLPGYVLGQLYEDKRCRCICPSPAAVLNNSVGMEWKLYIASVPPTLCNCDGVIVPKLAKEIKGRETEYCPRCDCKYEIRNTTIIKVVVVIVIWMITLLSIYSVFLICLGPLIKKKRTKHYEEFEEDEGRNLLIDDLSYED